MPSDDLPTLSRVGTDPDHPHPHTRATPATGTSAQAAQRHKRAAGRGQAWRGRGLTLALAGLLPLLPMAGCTSLGVQPWERDLLAKPAMQLGASPLESAIDDHIHFSKEAAVGGRGFGGGGCGCN